MALKSGSGFEFITTTTEQALVDEINAAKAEGRMARIASVEDPSQAACAFCPEDLSGYMHIPVNRVARVGP